MTTTTHETHTAICGWCDPAPRTLAVHDTLDDAVGFATAHAVGWGHSPEVVSEDAYGEVSVYVPRYEWMLTRQMGGM